MYSVYAIKDMISSGYVKFGGRGDRTLWHTITPELDEAFTYNSKGPATAFINQYNNLINSPHTVNPQNLPPLGDFIVIEIIVECRELTT